VCHNKNNNGSGCEGVEIEVRKWSNNKNRPQDKPQDRDRIGKEKERARRGDCSCWNLRKNYAWIQKLTVNRFLKIHQHTRYFNSATYDASISSPWSMCGGEVEKISFLLYRQNNKHSSWVFLFSLMRQTLFDFFL